MVLCKFQGGEKMKEVVSEYRNTSAKLNNGELNSFNHSILWNKEAFVGQLQNSGIFISVGISWQ